MSSKFSLDQIVKAYDVRGTVPDQFDAEVAYALGVGFAQFTKTSVAIVARDMRPTGPELVAAFAQGLMEQGVDVIDIGLASTDLLYFAAGKLDAPGSDVYRITQSCPVQRNQVVLVGCPTGRGGHGSC